jgi:hypothetical protein
MKAFGAARAAPLRSARHARHQSDADLHALVAMLRYPLGGICYGGNVAPPSALTA